MYKVFHVTGGVRNTISGVQTFIKNNSTTDEEFDFLVGESNGEDFFPFNQYLDEHEINRVVFPDFKKNPLKNIIQYAKECDAFYKENQVDIVHLHNPITAFIHNYYAKKNDVPVIIYHNHNTKYSDSFLKSLRNYVLVELALKNTTHLISCGQYAGEKIFRKRDFTVIPNGIDISKFTYNAQHRKEIRENYGLTENQVLIGSIGIISERKNQVFLLEMAKKLPDYVFMFVGEGEDREKLEKEYAHLQNVIFTGRREDSYKFYSAFDFFAFPSLFEGFSIAMIEAQTAGCRTVFNEDLDLGMKLLEQTELLPLVEEKWLNYFQGTKPLTSEERKQVAAEKSIQRFDIKNTFLMLKQKYKEFLKE